MNIINLINILVKEYLFLSVINMSLTKLQLLINMVLVLSKKSYTNFEHCED